MGRHWTTRGIALFVTAVAIASVAEAAWAEEDGVRLTPGEVLQARAGRDVIRPEDRILTDTRASRWLCQGTQCIQPYRFSLEFEIGPVWQSRNEAAIPGDTGTRFDLDDITGAGAFPYGRLTLDWRVRGRHSVRALIAPLSVEGTSILDQDVSFRGQTFNAGLSTKARYKFNSYRIGYRYRLWSGRNWELNVGATVKIRDAEIRLRQGSRQARKTDLGFVPLLHVDFEWRFRPGWRLVADLDGLAAEQGRAFDFSVKVQRDLSDRLSMGLGYRTIEGGADNDDTYTFAWLHQALVSFTYRF